MSDALPLPRRRRKHSTREDPPLLMRLVKGRTMYLEPVAKFDAEQLEKVRDGALIYVTVEEPRSPELNRFLHALTNKVAIATGQPHWVVRNRVKNLCGLMRKFVELDTGDVYVEAGSLNDLNEPEFREFVTRACEAISTTLLPGVDTDELIKMTREDLKAIRRSL